eukprot:TRINITY_DN51312_c0_g1_i1.p1 TRINITY_DN51312_c0_g1~~TRINITY_DN51312_c0_g1_i1.p1  ORF type:complete len:420 (+),score=83.03 TRINITY_DN51312_c0_g1_i1:68-1327(+)
MGFNIHSVHGSVLGVRVDEALPQPRCRRQSLRALALVAIVITGLREIACLQLPATFTCIGGIRCCRGGRTLVGHRSGSLRATLEDVVDGELDDDLGLAGDLEDDWGTEDEEDEDDISAYGVVAEQDNSPNSEDKFLEPESEGNEERVKKKPDKFASREALDAMFDNVAMGASNLEQQKWLTVPINDTWWVKVAQVPGGAGRFLEMMRGTTTSGENRTESQLDILAAGDTAWPATIIAARWLNIQPPVVTLAGKTLVELGAGTGLAGVVAAKLGARVLLQDRDEFPLREAMETAVKEQVASSITTLRCDWDDLLAKLMAGKEALAPFGQPDVLLGTDVLYSEESVEKLVPVLQILLRSPSQVAYFIDPYKREHRKQFLTLCQSFGLDAKEDEIVTWEPEWDNRIECEEDWVMRLLTVRSS